MTKCTERFVLCDPTSHPLVLSASHDLDLTIAQFTSDEVLVQEGVGKYHIAGVKHLRVPDLDSAWNPLATGHSIYIHEHLVEVETAQHWNSRGQFLGAAVEAMRRILVDRA